MRLNKTQKKAVNAGISEVELIKRVSSLEEQVLMLRGVLKTIADNAPEKEPPRVLTSSLTPEKALIISWSFWKAGMQARAVIATVDNMRRKSKQHG